MAKEIYTYQPARMVITDYGNRRVLVKYIDIPASVEEAIGQAEWATKVMHNIAKKYETKKFLVLADSTRLRHLPMDDRVQAIYRKLTDEPFIEKIASVVNGFGFVKLLVIKFLLQKNKDRAQLFFDIDKGKQWLGW